MASLLWRTRLGVALATTGAAVVVLAGWWVLGPEISVSAGGWRTGAANVNTVGSSLDGSLDGPLGLLLLAAGQWVFVAGVADGLCPRAPILVSGTVRCLTGLAVAVAAVWLGYRVLG